MQRGACPAGQLHRPRQRRGHGSFSTANRIPAQGDCLNFRCIHESHIDDAFRAVAEATEEAVLRSMLEAHPVTGYTGKVRPELGEFWQP